MSSLDNVRELPLVWFGSFREPSGYADEARAYLLALERSGYEAVARELEWCPLDAGVSGAQLAAIDRALARPTPQGEHVWVHHFVPQVGHPSAPGAANVVRTMFETDRIPSRFKQRLFDVDEIWVPASFNVDTFQRGGIPAERIRVLPETIDFDLYNPDGPEPWPIEGRRGFTFLTNFDFTDRKGWDLLLDAWARAFDPDDDVCLVLKCLSFHLDDAGIRERISARIGGRPTAPILVETAVLPIASLPQLYAGADAYVMASRGEGWGRPYMEAMAMGLPTIGSRWSGNLDFMDDDNAWLVDGKLVTVGEKAQSHTPLYRGHRWFEPDPDALVAALREVAAGGPTVEARAGAARENLLSRFGPEIVADRIAELTHDLLERSRARRARRTDAVWRGDFGSCHSLAVVNEGHLSALKRLDISVELQAPEGACSTTEAVGVASQWPPSFDAPSAGPFVLYQPWEFGRVPKRWVDSIRDVVDEVWAPSESVRAAYVDSGVAQELVHVVPNGVDLDRFTPEGPSQTLPTAKGTVFLFVGGTIHRKGIDVLLAAYQEAFTAADDVCLAIKGFGGDTVYRGQTAEALIGDMRADPNAPELLFLDEDVPFAELPSLYRAADVLVQPYRAEGFCLPALEALACGVPLIVTAGGPTDDFVSDACAWRIPSTRTPIAAEWFAADGLTLASDGFVLEPDRAALVTALKAATDPTARSARAGTARAHAEPFGWDAAAERAQARLTALAGRTPIRHLMSAAVPGRRGFLFLVPAEWKRRETWAPALHAYLEAFSDADDVTLVFPSAVGDDSLALLGAELETIAGDQAAAPDIALADAGALGTSSLELAADAVICAGDHRPARARLVVPPDPAALRAAAPIVQEAA